MAPKWSYNLYSTLTKSPPPSLHEHAVLSESKDKTACPWGEYPVGSGANLLRQAIQIEYFPKMVLEML